MNKYRFLVPVQAHVDMFVLADNEEEAIKKYEAGEIDKYSKVEVDEYDDYIRIYKEGEIKNGKDI